MDIGGAGEGRHRPARSSLHIAFDAEGAVPLMDRHFQSGNDLSGGGGFKVRVGDQFRFPGLRFTPEVGYGFDHLFATDDTNTSYAWDMHRLFAGARIGFGRFIVPTFYGHVGYGWRIRAIPPWRRRTAWPWTWASRSTSTSFLTSDSEATWSTRRSTRSRIHPNGWRWDSTSISRFDGEGTGLAASSEAV